MPLVSSGLTVLVVLVVLALILAPTAVRVLQECERAVLFRPGRVLHTMGLVFMIPGIDRMQKVDLRVVTMEVSAQEVITRENVTVKVNAVIYFRVMDPVMAVV